MPATYGVETFLAPPPDYDVNFAYPQRRGDVEIYWVTGVGNALMAFFLGQRMYTKLAHSNGLRLDDGLLILAWITSVIVQGLIASTYASGVAGVHAWEVSLDKYQSHQLTTYVTTLFYVLCAVLAKLSLSVYYLRLSPSIWYRRSVCAVINLLVVYSFILACALIFSCSPISKVWHTDVPGACLDRSALYTAVAVMDILTNAILLVLPIPMVYGLPMPIKRRVCAAGIFAIGLLAIITSLILCAYLPKLAKSEDQTWAMVSSNLWISIEVNLFVICPAMLTLYEFCHELKRRWTGKHRRRLSLDDLPITASTPTLMSSSASVLTLKSTHITTIDAGLGSKDQRDRDQRRKKFLFFGRSTDSQSDGSGMSSHLQALKGNNGSRVSIGLCDETELEDQRTASALTIRAGEGDGEKGILMTTTVTVMREEGP
ncbi:hypothetical protein PG987_013086 [Apiospora arundinis]